jgi:hypothetical protein
MREEVINELYKFGGIVHCELVTQHQNILVYVKCNTTNAAVETMEKLNDSLYKGLILILIIKKILSLFDAIL